MNPGISEEIGQTTRGMIDALKANPLVLALVFMNVAMIAFMFYYISQTFGARTSNLDSLFKTQEQLFGQWQTLFVEQGKQIERSMECVRVEDAIKLFDSANRPKP